MSCLNLALKGDMRVLHNINMVKLRTMNEVEVIITSTCYVIYRYPHIKLLLYISQSSILRRGNEP